jgi:hypothetical protein
MSATRNFSRWAVEIANDPLYPRGLPKDEDTVALYVMLTEALAVAAAEADITGRNPAITWMPSEHRRRHYLN